jgi:heterodisulfide reductase subunit C
MTENRGPMTEEKSFQQEVEQRSGQNIKPCYQCFKCFAGCTMADHMDKKPNGILRMIQYEEREKVLKSKDIWYCVSCKKCGVRCPNNVDMSVVFDTLREMSLESGYAYEVERKIPVIHEEFIRNIKMFGRLHEASFFVAYMIRSLDLFSNLPSGIPLMLRGKLPIMPRQIKGIDELREMVDKTYRTKKKT